MAYSVKEIFYTLQGEGANAGHAAVFCRFAGCNLWSGLERDRENAVCQFCDTDFVGTDGLGGGKFATAEVLAAEIAGHWGRLPLPTCGGAVARSVTEGGILASESDKKTPPPTPSHKGRGEIPHKLIVFTGGEPLLQLDEALIAACHALGFTIAVETNGTIAPPTGIDWLCVSPKAGAPLLATTGDELKLVYPQATQLPETVAHLPFKHFFLQPMDGSQQAENTRATIAYCMAHPQWRLSLQTHKIVGIR